jgi:hypothetical protein
MGTKHYDAAKRDVKDVPAEDKILVLNSLVSDQEIRNLVSSSNKNEDLT